MKLIRFRVTNFRSVEDSDWIEVDDVAALIGTNESGKTNVLLPLWKLNPAKRLGATFAIVAVASRLADAPALSVTTTRIG